MEPRYDGYYLSGLQRSEDWHAGVRMVSEYFRYLKLFETGFWLAKNHPTPDLDFPAYLDTITERSFWEGLAGRDPLDAEYEFLHQIGRYIRHGDQLEFVHRHFLVVMHERSWALRMEPGVRLVSADGAAYGFIPLSRVK